jgi:hypothetical protein
MMLVVSPFLISCHSVDAVGPGLSSSVLDGVSLGNTSDVQIPLKVSYAKDLGLTLDDVDMGMVIGSSFAHQEIYLTAHKVADAGNSTVYRVNTSYQIVSHTDIGFEMGLPREGNYSVNDDLTTSPKETRQVTAQVEFRLAMLSEGELIMRDADSYITSCSGHVGLRCEMIIQGTNLPVAVFHGDYTDLTYQDVNGSMRCMTGLNYSLILDPVPTIQSSSSGFNLTANASLSMGLTGFIDAKGIPQNIQDEMFGKTLASYGIFTLPVRFEDIGYLVQAINRHSLGNQTIPIEMAMSSSGANRDGSSRTALTFGGVNSTVIVSTRNDRLVGMELQNPWRSTTSVFGLSLDSWDLEECTYDQAENGMNLTLGLMGSLPSSLFSNDTQPLSATDGTAASGASSGPDLWPVASIIIVVALAAVAAIAYKRKR